MPRFPYKDMLKWAKEELAKMTKTPSGVSDLLKNSSDLLKEEGPFFHTSFPIRQRMFRPRYPLSPPPPVQPLTMPKGHVFYESFMSEISKDRTEDRSRFELNADPNHFWSSVAGGLDEDSSS